MTEDERATRSRGSVPQETTRERADVDVETTSAPGAIVLDRSDRPIVSIVMVTYGTGAIALDAVAAVAQRTALPFELLLVDNPTVERPSTVGLLQHGTADLLRARTAGLRLLTPSRNLGFGGGNDLGAAHASGEFLCLLNPDVIVGAGWLEPLIAALQDPIVGVVGPVLVDPDPDVTLQEAGQLIFADGNTAAVGGREVLTGDWSQAFSRDVDYLSAACWVVRRDEHLGRGGFDPRYHPAYFEDADYALRVEDAGQRSRLVADVPLVHHHGLGGAWQDQELARASQAVFRSVWADRLRRQPPRPGSDAEALVGRDRLATARVAFVDRSRSTPAPEALAEVATYARDHPRERVTFVASTFDGLDVAAARRAGVETVAGDLDEIVTARAFTEMHDAGPGASPVPATPTASSSPPAASAPGATSDHRTPRAVEPDTGPQPWHTGARVAAVALVGLIGLVLRIVVLRSPAGALNADEAYTGIQSFQILAGDLPVVLGGTVYTLPVESYLYAPFVAAFGAQILPLKLLTVAFWIAGGVLVGVIGGRLGTRRTGLTAVALFWLTPGAMLLLSTTAYAAYGSGMVVTLAAFALALRLADSAEPADWLLGTFGVAAGFGFWLHPMFSATLLPMVGFVLWVHRRPVAWAWVVGGGIVGAGPLVAWNLVHGFPSLEPPVDVEGTYLERLRTFATDLLPRAFGLRDGALAWEVNPVVGLLLYLALIALVIVGLVALVRRGRGTSRLLLPVVLISAFPIMAVFENLIFAADGRYGVITFPFLVLAAALGVGALLDGALGATPGRAAATLGAVAAVWLLGFVAPGLVSLVRDTDSPPNDGVTAVVGRLDEVGIDRIVGSYWAVHPVDFVGDRRIEAAVTAFHPVRFPTRQRAVESSPPESVAFVFRLEDDDPALLWLPQDAYAREVVDGYVLYVPLAAVSGG